MKDSAIDLQSLVSRLQKLEEQNRRWKFVNVLFLLSGVSLFTLGAKPSDRVDSAVLRATAVEAQEFVLKNENSRVYAVLTTNLTPRLDHRARTYTAFGDPATLRFYDEGGHLIWTAPPDLRMIPSK